VFFEPGPWQPPGSIAVPASIPAPSRAHMATPAGLLLHELSNAPAPLVDAAEVGPAGICRHYFWHNRQIGNFRHFRGNFRHNWA